MTEHNCVCGHPESEHTGMSGQDRYCKHGKKDGNTWVDLCHCDNYRPALPWPDEPGWWYMTSDLPIQRQIYCDQIVWCGIDESGTGGIQLVGLEGRLLREDTERESLRFTKCPPNPFAREGED